MSIFQKWNKSGKAWDYYIDYRFQGRRIREKIGPNKTLAQTVLRKRLVEIAEGKFLAKPQEVRTTLQEMVNLYMENYAKPSKRSWRTDQYRLDRLVKHFGDVNLTQITPLKIEAYRAGRKGKAKDSTLNRDITALKGLFSKAVEWGKAQGNPVKKVKLFKENNARTRFLEKGDIANLLACSSERLRPILMVALHTGMRKGEIFNLTWDDVDFKNRLIKVRDSKSKEARMIDMSLPLLKTLQELPKSPDCPQVFTDDAGARAKSRGAIRTQFETALKKACIRDFRFHDLRHTFASQLAMSGVDLFTIGAFLGHKSGYRMTQRYAHLSPQHRAKAIRALDGIAAAVQPGGRDPTSQMDTQVDTWTGKPGFEPAERFAKISTDCVINSKEVGCQSGQMDWSVKPAGYALRRFESFPNHTLTLFSTGRPGAELDEKDFRDYLPLRLSRPAKPSRHF